MNSSFARTVTSAMCIALIYFVLFMKMELVLYCSRFKITLLLLGVFSPQQYYVYLGGQRYVDLGLGTHRVKCRVHENFR